jgi:hypothetical protein
MPGSVNNARYWRSRAEETRTLGDAMTDTKTRDALHRIARDYDNLARMADEREELLRRVDGGGKA